ncbi:hypothetical protein [Candidatus Blastococcus massiliensis]|uniref:hypothetical protein n=1 Tax=Candidatus Blastococcus massiliensis TaxID=1470358 RepID=UPI0004B62BCD|nr:hypothetical protein [Candidatus Blastococcus massiliensis]
MTDELWRPHDRMADEFLAHPEDGAYARSCFDRVLESDAWSSLPTGLNEVRYWPEPLSNPCAAATDAGFVIQRLEHELLSRPGFLALRLLAPA